VTGWMLSEVEFAGDTQGWEPQFRLGGGGSAGERLEGAGTDSALCSSVMLHLAANRDMAPRFVRRCEEYAARGGQA
jgi:hypothetical protein